MRTIRLGYYGRRLGGFGATRSTAPAYMPPSPSADPVFVGPAIEAPLPQQRILSPSLTPIVPASGSPPRSIAWSPPVVRGESPCTGVMCPGGLTCVNGACVDPNCIGVLCPAGQHCEGGACVGAPAPAAIIPQVDNSMRAPREPVFTMPDSGATLAPTGRPGPRATLGPTGPAVMPGSRVPGMNTPLTAAAGGSPTAPPVFYPGGGGGGRAPGGTQADDQRQIPVLADPAPAGGSGALLAAVAAYFLFF